MIALIMKTFLYIIDILVVIATAVMAIYNLDEARFLRAVTWALLFALTLAIALAGLIEAISYD